MGIYADIQADMKEAMDDDLADAVATLTITEKASSTSYNPVGGSVTNIPVINTMRCVIVDADLKDEGEVYSETTSSDIEVMVLDSERTGTFKIGDEANVRGLDYLIRQYKIDPAGATHNLELRRL